MAKNQRNALLNRNFLLLVQGGWISQVGTQVAMVATSYWIKRSTDSASLVGLLATTAALPVLFLSPVAGAVADRCSKRNTLIFWDILGGIVSWGFFFLIGLHVFSLHQILVGIFLGNLVLSTAATFSTPACNAFVAELVQTEQLGKAMAFTQASGLIAIIVGQAAA